jgi:alpha-1,2-mannosyltransferase
MPSVSGVVRSLSDCAWLDAERARAYARILLAVTLVGAVGWIALGSGGLDRQAKPIGTDFVGFYTASRWALDGRPNLAYDVGAHWAAQRALFGSKVGYTAFFYPPPALLICLPLALAPYFVSLAVWLAATGFASAALIGGGLLVMDRRPVLAGACFGAMAYKPHLALVIPFALLFARRWTTLIVAAVTAASFCLASLIAFGASTWGGFFADASFAGAALQNNLVGNEKMQSVFAAVRLLRGSLALAWGAQIAAALCAIGALWLLQGRAFRTAAEAPAVVCAGLLASPFVLDYDLTLVAIPLVWLLCEGRRNGFLPFEKALMALAFALPLISRIAAGALGLPLAPLTIAAVLALIVRRALMPATDNAGAVALDASLRIPLSLALEQ